MQQDICVISVRIVLIRNDALIAYDMVGCLAKGVGVGQRGSAWSLLRLDGDVALVYLSLQACNLCVHLLLGVVVGEVNAGGVYLLPVIYGIVLSVVDGYIPVRRILSLLG